MSISFVIKSLHLFSVHLQKTFVVYCLTSFLEKVPVFSELPEMALLALAKNARLDYFPDTRALLWEGEANHDFYLIMDGHVGISAVSRFGWIGTLRVMSAGEGAASSQSMKQPPFRASKTHRIFGPFSD